MISRVSCIAWIGMETLRQLRKIDSTISAVTVKDSNGSEHTVRYPADSLALPVSPLSADDVDALIVLSTHNLDGTYERIRALVAPFVQVSADDAFRLASFGALEQALQPEPAAG